jgi:hypothetical protein
MPESPSPKDVISITAGRRPAAKEQHILPLPERQDRFRIDNAGAGLLSARRGGRPCRAGTWRKTLHPAEQITHYTYNQFDISSGRNEEAYGRNEETCERPEYARVFKLITRVLNLNTRFFKMNAHAFNSITRAFNSNARVLNLKAHAFKMKT